MHYRLKTHQLTIVYISPFDIIQINGHRNLQSIKNYSHISDPQHRDISTLISQMSNKPQICVGIQWRIQKIH